MLFRSGSGHSSSESLIQDQVIPPQKFSLRVGHLPSGSLPQNQVISPQNVSLRVRSPLCRSLLQDRFIPPQKVPSDLHRPSSEFLPQDQVIHHSFEIPPQDWGVSPQEVSLKFCYPSSASPLGSCHPSSGSLSRIWSSLRGSRF